jgi:hypothetical protein
MEMINFDDVYNEEIVIPQMKKFTISINIIKNVSTEMPTITFIDSNEVNETFFLQDYPSYAMKQIDCIKIIFKGINCSIAYEILVNQ